jgi:pyrroline-5-carboxylate reductase
LNLPPEPTFIFIAIKPQMIPRILPKFSHYGNGLCVFLSIAAGVKISSFEALLGQKTPIIRAMPNTPAEIGLGITAQIANENVSKDAFEVAGNLLSAIGEVVNLNSEDQMDAVTGLSGSGPAYVFYLIDALAVASVTAPGVLETFTPWPFAAFTSMWLKPTPKLASNFTVILLQDLNISSE